MYTFFDDAALLQAVLGILKSSVNSREMTRGTNNNPESRLNQFMVRYHIELNEEKSERYWTEEDCLQEDVRSVVSRLASSVREGGATILSWVSAISL